jgi:hypothetical protein
MLAAYPSVIAHVHPAPYAGEHRRVSNTPCGPSEAPRASGGSRDQPHEQRFSHAAAPPVSGFGAVAACEAARR